MPLRPNSETAATASAKGGLTIGSKAITWMSSWTGRGFGTRTWT